MKLLLNLFIIGMLSIVAMNAADIDVRKKPEPLPESDFVFPKHTVKTLSNGLKVFIIEDHEQPTISLRLLVPGGSSVDAATPGLSDLVAGMMTKGSGKLSAFELANKLDGVGASISASSSTDYITVNAYSIKKHLSLLLETFGDIVKNPTFPKEEIEKLKKQYIAGIQNDKSNPNKIGAALSRKIILGENHPYAAKATAENVEAINRDLIVKYYQTYFLPNAATLAVIGDVNPDEIVSQLEKKLEYWKKGNVVKIDVPTPKPMPMGVYFVHRPGSTQSSVIVNTPAVAYNHPDYETLSIAGKVMGSGFGGRLFRTLREKYSFTYTPFGAVTSAKYANRFTCGADVKMDKTDSSVTVILEQMGLLANEAPEADEFYRLKRFEIGQYKTNFESSDFIASLVQSADFLGISIDHVKDFPVRMQNLPATAVSAVADRYMNPKQAYIVVVGDPKVKSSLEKFGKIYEYNLDLEPITGEAAKMEDAKLDASELIEKHITAIGGKDAIAAVNSISSVAKANMSMQGQSIDGEITEITKAGNKYSLNMDMKMFKQSIVYNGTDCFAVAQGMKTKIEGKQLDQIKLTSTLFNTTKLKELGYKLEVLGKQNGKILLKATSANGDETTYYFDSNTFLVSEVEQLEETQDGPSPVTIKMSNYKKVGAVMLPGTIETNSVMFNMKVENDYKLNEAIDETIFEVKK